MTIQVHLFAGLRDAADVDVVTIDADDPLLVRELIDRVANEMPDAAALVRHSKVALDGVYLSDEQSVEPPTSCDLIPPVSGG